MGATAGISLAIGSSLSNFVTQQSQASAIAAQGVYEARLFEHNADIADLQYQDALTRGRIQAGRRRQEARTLIGSQRAAASESGIAVDDGTVLDLTQESAFFGELDAERIAADAAREALGFKLQASDYRRQSLLTRMASRNAARAQRSASIGTLLAGAGEAYNIYDRDR